jgi:DNA primase
MNVEETILYSEVRKILRARSGTTGSSLPPVIGEKSPRQSSIPNENPEDLNNEELELLRFLLKYCKIPLFEQDSEHSDNPEIISVGRFIISQLQEENLVSDKPVFKTIITEIAERLDDQDFRPEHHFIFHPDKKISQLASNLLAEKWIESKRWNKAGSYTEKEADILDWLIPRIVNEFKLYKIKEMHMELEKQVDILHRMKEDTLLFEVLAKIQNLKKNEKFLSDNLGSRAII